MPMHVKCSVHQSSSLSEELLNEMVRNGHADLSLFLQCTIDMTVSRPELKIMPLTSNVMDLWLCCDKCMCIVCFLMLQIKCWAWIT